MLLLFGSLVLYYSCAEKRDPLSITAHPEGWSSEQSSIFHGRMVLENNASTDNCKTCHGVDYEGGSSNVSCSSDLCHSEPDGPEACNTCHGNFSSSSSDTSSWAPPENLYGNLNTSSIGVGAHQSHLVNNTWTTAYQQNCSLCHIEPNTLSSSGHIDDYPYQAEITFSSIASKSHVSNPIWNHSNATCDNVYCHGAFVFNRDSSSNSWGYTDQFMVGNNPQMNWTSVGTGQASCGSCHGLPPQGHTAATTCNGCHPRVVDGNFNIIDKNLHINGEKDLF